MVTVTRTHHRLEPDPTRVVGRPFVPGHANFGGVASRVGLIIDRISALSDEEVDAEIRSTRSGALGRHRDIDSTWHRNADMALDLVAADGIRLEGDRRTLLGMIFTQEYAFEAAALCNPSVVPIDDPDERDDLSFVMSTRAIGEGHISSIAFQTGRVSADGTVTIDEGSRWACNGTRRPASFEQVVFRQRLRELGADNDLSERVLAELSPRFSIEDLEEALAHLRGGEVDGALRFETERAMHWLAASNYEVSFPEVPLAERVLSPASPAESRGMEDARFVRFTDEDGSVRFYATYTAFDGFEVLPQLIETADFQTFRVATLAGARSKGMALFPRRVGGDFMALARTDNESTFVMRSDHVRHWDAAELVLRPTEPWEVVQAGNCGSPLETSDGWLVVMHGVGPMRRYVLSAVMLDLDEPTKVIGRLRDPLLEPDESERNGYVPNVVYSCGGLLHGDVLVIPYGYADSAIRMATVSLAELVSSLR